MKQIFTILFDLDGTLVDTAPDLMCAHNHVMKKFGYPTKSTDEIRNLVGQGAGAMLGRVGRRPHDGHVSRARAGGRVQQTARHVLDMPGRVLQRCGCWKHPAIELLSLLSCLLFLAVV